VNNNSTEAESSNFIENEDLVLGLFVGSFSQVNNERSSVGCGCESPPYVFLKRKRVSPTVLFDDMNGKILSKDLRFVGIVVADGSDAGKQVFDSSPPETHRFWYRKMLA